MVAVAPGLTVLDRRRIDLIDPAAIRAKQPYHTAETMNLPDAKQFLDLCLDRATELAAEAIRATVADLESRRYQIDACGVLFASGRIGASLSATLASHALIHTADGDHFRNAIASAAKTHGLMVSAIKERELTNLAPAEIILRVGAMGKTMGPPWTQDEKLATLAAYLVLEKRV